MHNISEDSRPEEIIEWARINYYAHSVKSRKLLISFTTEDSYLKADQLNILGILDMYDSDYFNALGHFKNVLTLAEDNKYNELKAKVCLNLFSLYERLDNIPEALRYATKVFSTGYNKVYGSTYYNLARINLNSNNLVQAEDYLDKSLKAYIKNDSPAIFHAYFLKSEILIAKEEYEEALAEYKKTLIFLDSTTMNSFRAATLNEIGHTYLRLGKAKEAIQYIEEGINVAIEYSINRDKAIGYLRLAQCYYSLKEYDKAEKNINLFLNDEYEKEGNSIYFRDAHELRIEIYKKSNSDKLHMAYDAYLSYLKEYEVARNNELHKKYFLIKDAEISDIRNKSDEIEKQNKELRYISKLLAHDLKTPVRTIGSFTSLLEKAHASSTDTVSKEYSEFISKGANEIYVKLDITEKYLNLSLKNISSNLSLKSVIEDAIKLREKSPLEFSITGDLHLSRADISLMKKAFYILHSLIIKKRGDSNVKLNYTLENETSLLILKDDQGITSDIDFWSGDIFNVYKDETNEGFMFLKKIIELNNGRLEWQHKEKCMHIYFS